MSGNILYCVLSSNTDLLTKRKPQKEMKKQVGRERKKAKREKEKASERK